MEYYHILSLDGGGIRGVMSAAIVERLERAQPFLDDIELFAGTSTGAIIALGLAAGFSPSEVREIYEVHGKDVFKDSLVDNIRDLGNLIGADYSNDNLKQLLTQRYGDMRLADLPKKVLISSFDLDNEADQVGGFRTWKPKFFHNFPGEDSDEEQRVVDVALRTTAAPTFFPAYQGYVDGAVVAGNPSMCALAQALHEDTGGQSLEQIVLLSIGAGRNPHYLPARDADWGLVQWARHLVALMLEGSVGLADYQCYQALRDRYLRLDPVLPKEISMDAVEEIPLLVRIAEREDLSKAFEWLERYSEPVLPKEIGMDAVEEIIPLLRRIAQHEDIRNAFEWLKHHFG